MSKPESNLAIGILVRYYDPNRGWHIGTVLKVGRKYAILLHPVKGKKKVPLADVQAWESVQ